MAPYKMTLTQNMRIYPKKISSAVNFMGEDVYPSVKILLSNLFEEHIVLHI